MAEQPSLSSASTATNQASDSLRDRVRSLQLPRDDGRRGNGSAVWIVVVLLLLVGGAWGAWQAGLLATILGTDEGEGSGKKPAATASDDKNSDKTNDEKKVATDAKPVDRSAIALESKGYITPAHRILVSPKVNGMLTSLNIEEGMRVKKGDVLGVIESVEYDADVRRAESLLIMAEQKSLEMERGSRQLEIDQAKAELRESESRIAQLEAEYQRSEKLVKVGGVAQSVLDEALANFDAQKRRVDRLKFALALMEEGPRVERKALAKAEIEQTRADLTKAKWRLDNCTIKSPISGTILKKNAEEGNIVNPIAFNGSFSLCEMADLSDLEVELNVQERDVSKVFKGQKCKVRAEAYSDRVYEGYVDRLMPFADRAKGAVPVRVKIKVPSEEEGVYLKPDMGAIVTFYKAEQQKK